MVNILHVMAGVDAGGISTVVLNYYKHINREQFHFDIAITTHVIGQNGRAFQNMGAEIFVLPLKSKGLKIYKSALSKLLSERQYDIVHVHDNETSYIALSVAKSFGVRGLIAHAHSSSPFVSIKGEIRRLSGCYLNGFYATKLIACGKLAGNRIFGKYNMNKNKTIILPNAVDAKCFCFNEDTRKEVRKSFRIEDKFVIGMVGRIAPEKNNVYAISLFRAIQSKMHNSVMVIVGNGEDEKKMLDEINRLNLNDDILYLGKRNDVNLLYQAFDVLMLPSLHEGFPVVAVEAMSSGLPILLSDTITRELEFGSAIHYLSLDEKDAWAEAAIKYCDDNERGMRMDEVKSHGLDIRDTAEVLENIYMSYNQ